MTSERCQHHCVILTHRSVDFNHLSLHYMLMLTVHEMRKKHFKFIYHVCMPQEVLNLS